MIEPYPIELMLLDAAAADDDDAGSCSLTRSLLARGSCTFVIKDNDGHGVVPAQTFPLNFFFFLIFLPNVVDYKAAANWFPAAAAAFSRWNAL